jgi:hypothetical protein
MDAGGGTVRIYTIIGPTAQQPVVNRYLFGVEDGLVVLTLACGHQCGGLTCEWNHFNEIACNQCMTRHCTEEEWKRMQQEVSPNTAPKKKGSARRSKRHSSQQSMFGEGF